MSCCELRVASCVVTPVQLSLSLRAKLLSRMRKPLTLPSATLSPLARGEGLLKRSRRASFSPLAGRRCREAADEILRCESRKKSYGNLGNRRRRDSRRSHSCSCFWIETTTVKLLIAAEHGMDRVQQLAHDGDVDLQRLLSSVAQLRSVSSYARLEAAGHTSRKIKRRAKIFVASFGDPWRHSHRGPGLELSWVQTGMRDPLPIAHVRGQDGQFGKNRDRADLADSFDA